MIDAWVGDNYVRVSGCCGGIDRQSFTAMAALLLRTALTLVGSQACLQARSPT
ncbi:hypothetical protein XMIN_234 [Xanthomonas citri pv. mangiferaeindicae LMG 941]|nr:hypothetical protein XMIN_234 [Xanthomonas citri pv. mangiferaeindicae LMG 941]